MATDTVYNLANGSRRRLRICSHCKQRVRTIQAPDGPEHLAQEMLKPTGRFGVKLTAAKAVEIREAAAAGTAHKVLADRYGVRWQTIAQVVYGITWSHAGGPIKARKTRKTTQTCTSCDHFDGRCEFGFPEAVSEPWFAGECDLYRLR